jgi:hypothetical protein
MSDFECNKMLKYNTKVGNCEVIPQALWPIAKSLLEREGPKAPTAIHYTLGITYQPNEKADVIADCLEKQFTSHDLCEENHCIQVETTVQALLTSESRTLLGIIRPREIHNLAN